ncbi:MAG: hypothetical protein AAF468_20630 [Pseudomonadota bacterium]
MNRSLSILNDQGDMTFTWGEEDDARMEAIIAEKMKAGVVFFIVEPRAFGLLSPKKTKLGKATDAKKHRSLSVEDEHLQAFVVTSNTGDVVSSPAGEVQTKRKAKSAKEAATGHSVGVKPLRGG